MNAKTLLCLAALTFAASSATHVLAAEEPLPSHGIAPLGPDEGIHAALANSKAGGKAKNKNAEISLGAAWIYDTRGDVPGHCGWGGTVSFLFSPPLDESVPDLRLKMGAEILVFHTHGASSHPTFHRKESLDAGTISYLVGIDWTTPWQRLEIGALASFGLGGAYLDTRDDFSTGGHKARRNGNVDWTVQIHPRATIHFTDHASLTLGYRLGFISPVLRTEGFIRRAVNYRTVDIVHQSVEAAFSIRF